MGRYRASYRTMSLRKLAGELEDLEGREAEATAEDEEDRGERLDEDEIARLAELRKLGRDIGCDGSSEMRTYARDEDMMIHSDDFPKYAREWAEEVHGIDTSAWPFDSIDWKEASKDLLHEWTQAEVDGDLWLIRDR